MQDWSDLVEYVINKLISSPQCLPGVIPTFSQLETRENTIEDQHQHHPNQLTIEEMPADKEWTEEELDSLNWYFAQCKGTATVSPLEEIARHFQEDGRVMRSPKEIADQLVIQGLLTEEEGVSYLATQTEVEVSLSEEKSDGQPKDDVQFLCHKLSQESPKVIGWLQQILLECAFIKLRIEEGITSNGDMLRGNCGGLPGIMEPVALIHIREYILQTEFFVQ